MIKYLLLSSLFFYLSFTSPAMADPGTMMLVAGVASVASGALGIVSSNSAAKAAQAQANYNAQVASNNAVLAERAAKMRADEQAVLTRSKRSAMLAKMGATGVLGSTGSSMDALLDQTQFDLSQNSKIIYGGKIEAAGYRSQAEISLFNGAVSKQQSKLDMLSGAVGTAASAGNLFASSGAGKGTGGGK